MSLLRVYLLGNPRFELGTIDLSIPRRKAAALLAYLCVTRKAHSRDSLATLFWPDYPQSSARANLRRELSRLHQSLGDDLFMIEREQIAINPDAEIWVDALELGAAIEQVQKHCSNRKPVCDTCHQRLLDAVKLYSGGFMAGFILTDCPGFDEWQYYERTNVQRQMEWALETLVESYIHRQDYSAAIPYAKRWLTLDNLHEPAHRALMRLYSHTGDRSSALRQYHVCQKLLEEELGVQPEAATVQLYEEIRSQDSHLHPPRISNATEEQGARTEERSKTTIKSQPSQLPKYPSIFIGREKELKEIRGLLESPDCRLLTLLGPGGAGKTRLAVQVAGETGALFPGGVYFIPLASLNSSRAILAALEDAFGLGSLGETSSPTDAIINYLENKEMLLVFDNFEHIADRAGILTEILTRTELVKILATSRQRLNLQHEWVMEIQGLAYPLLTAGKDHLQSDLDDENLPIAQFSAVALFLAAAQRVKVGFTPSTADKVSAARIAASVGGMPLAIELAAGWVNLLSFEEIRMEIEHDLNILETTSVDVPDRQRSLRSVFDHSWELLSEREKEIFPALSVFQGGFTRQAAQDVLGISLRELAGLANKSLLANKPDGRFELHELLKQYALEKLKENPQRQRGVESQHCEYFGNALKDWLPGLKSQRLVQTLEEVNSELANIQSAWDRAVRQGYAEWISGALEPLCLYFWRRIHFVDGFEACRSALEGIDLLPTEYPLLEGQLLAWRGKFSHAIGNTAEAEEDYTRSLQAVERSRKPESQTRLVRARALQGLGNLAHFKGEAEPVAEYYRESLSLYLAEGEDTWAADLLIDMAINLFEMHNNFEEGMKCLNESRELRKRSGDPFGPASLLFEMGITNLFELGNTQEALNYFEEARQIFSAHEGLITQADAMSCSLYLAFAQGNYLAARELGEQMLSIVGELGILRFLIMTYGMMAECDNGLGDYQQAELHIRQSVEMLQKYGELDIQTNMYSWSFACTLLAKAEVHEARSILESCVNASRQILGKHTLARNLATLSRAETAVGDKETAWMNAREALGLFLRYPHFHWYLYCLSTVAYLLAERGEIQRAVEVYACVTASPLAGYSCWFEDVYGKEIRDWAASLPTESYKAAQQHGSQTDPWLLGKEIFNEFFSN